MKKVNIDTLLFRASSMGEIMTSKDGITEIQAAKLVELGAKLKMTEKQSQEYLRLKEKQDNPKMALTTLRKSVEIYRTAATGRRPQLKNKYLSHGTDVEEDSITLYSLVKRQAFYKKKVRLNDTHFTGEIDTSDVDNNTDIMLSKIIVDAKSCWEVHTMPSCLDVLEKNYWVQMQTYMALIPNSESAVVAKCLVNHTAQSILKRIEGIRYRHNVLDTETRECLAEIFELEKNSIYDRALFKKHNIHYDFYISEEEWIENSYDIPEENRVHEFKVDRDDDYIRAMRNQVDECRQWLHENWMNI